MSLTGTEECDVCGMVIAEHPGPTGQIFYRDHRPENHENPARFDSLQGCLFPYYLERERRDWSPTVVYVTDYSRVDYEISMVEGQAYIETVTRSDKYATAEDVVLVIQSEVHGAMGPDFIPFSNGDEADAFSSEWGGQTVGFEDVTPEMLGP